MDQKSIVLKSRVGHIYVDVIKIVYMQTSEGRNGQTVITFAKEFGITVEETPDEIERMIKGIKPSS